MADDPAIEAVPKDDLQPKPHPVVRYGKVPFLILGTLVFVALAGSGLLRPEPTPEPPEQPGQGPAQRSVNRSLEDASRFDEQVRGRAPRFPSAAPAPERRAPRPQEEPETLPPAVPLLVPGFSTDPGQGTQEPTERRRRSLAAERRGSLVHRDPDAARQAILAQALSQGLPTAPAGFQAPREPQRATREDFLDSLVAHPPTMLAANEPRPRTLPEGSLIPAVLETRIESEIAGQLRAVVSRPVFDRTATEVLIPRGSTLHGQYQTEVLFGARRLLVAFHRLVLPDGRSFSLPPLEGADGLGTAGLSDQRRTPFLRTLRSAFLLGVISAAADTATNPSRDAFGREDAATAAVAREFQQVATEILRRDLNVTTTLRIRSGYVFHVMTDRDLVFP